MSHQPWTATPSLFADLPLREFVARGAQGPSHLLSALGGGGCVELVSANQVLRTARCSRTDGTLWVYEPRSMAFQSARDTSLCLDIFNGASLGAYWCHAGINQQFRAKEGSVGQYCSPYDDRFCVTVVDEAAVRDGGAGGPVMIPRPA